MSCASREVTAHPLLIYLMASQGDNDPVDVVEIGSVQCQQGGVYKVKPLGAYAMIDDGELDWKIVCIRTDDPLADVLNDIEDVERYTPPCTHSWDRACPSLHAFQACIQHVGKLQEHAICHETAA